MNYKLFKVNHEDNHESRAKTFLIGFLFMVKSEISKTSESSSKNNS